MHQIIYQDNKVDAKIAKYINRLGISCGKLNFATDFVSRIKYLAIACMATGIAVLLVDKINGIFIFSAIAVALILHFTITEGIFKRLALKLVNKRLRPYLRSEEIKPIGRNFNDSSFPSSHMALLAAILTVLFAYYPLWWPIYTLIAIFMAFARIHNGMHYLSDVVVGFMLGIIYGMGGLYIVSLFG